MGSTKARVMIVSERGIGKCIVWLYSNKDDAEKEAGGSPYTSQIIFDVDHNCSDLKELGWFGPAMPYNTIRKAARKCQAALQAAREGGVKCAHGMQWCPAHGECTICCDDSVPTTILPCCGKQESTNRICESCVKRVKVCPFCRAQ